MMASSQGLENPRTVLREDQPAIQHRFDDVSLLGLVVWSTWVLLLSTYGRRHEWSQLLWLCDVTTLGTAIGLFTRSRLLLTAQMTGALVCHIGWNADLYLYLVTGNMPFQATAYMFGGDYSPFEKALSFFQHTFVVPACAWGLLRLGVSRQGWLLQWLQTVAVFSLTYLLTSRSENINWIFGAGFLNQSPAWSSPFQYYLLMVLVVPPAIYRPVNALLGFVVAKYGLCNCRNTSCISIAMLCITGVVAGLAGLAGYAFQPVSRFPSGLLNTPAYGLTTLESLALNKDSPSIESISYGLAGHERNVPLQLVRNSLPHSGANNSEAGSLLLPKLFEASSFANLPWAPQQVIVRGKRGANGTVVCAVIGADRFYSQPICDTQTAMSTFQVYGWIGMEGLTEFAVAGTRERKLPAANQAITGGGLRSLFVVTVVAFNRTSVARGPFYIVQRTGIWSSDDVVWSSNNGHWTASIR